MLETEVRDGAQEFGLEEEVAEAGRVHAHVRALALLVVCARTRSSVVAVGTTGGGGGRGDRGLDDVLLVVCGCLPVSVRAQERRSAGVPMRSSVGSVEALRGDGDERWSARRVSARVSVLLTCLLVLVCGVGEGS